MRTYLHPELDILADESLQHFSILHGSVAILCAHAQENKLKSVPLTVLDKTIIASEIIILIQWTIHGRLQAVGRILTIAAAAQPLFS